MTDFKSTPIKNVKAMTVEQLEIINVNIVKLIQEEMIQIQTSQVIASHNNIS